ncbi:MAG: hypothetical protein CVU16_03705 [Betaproteobacteria bacterium HGW-Betaproteobacteria-10]|nr:MAG: hypothetical protein CVU16_03705 [Betaproteobacteria bacterium HGW-Betaproteobacteria-10]
MKQLTLATEVAIFLAISSEYFGLQPKPQPAVSKSPAILAPTTSPNKQRKTISNYRRLTRSIFLAAGLGAFLASPAFAEETCEVRNGREAHAEHHGKMMAAHHKQLHEALKLTPEQEAGWKKLLGAEQPKASTAGERPDWSKFSTLERAEKRLELLNARQSHMAEYVAALKDFYETLSSEQKQTFDKLHDRQQGGMRGKPGLRNPPAASSPAKS